MVETRAKFPQWWRSNYYEKDAPMPANRQQSRRLTKAGTAYYHITSEKKQPVEVEEPVETLTMSNTKKEIEQYLDDNGIEYDEYATKSELLGLIDG